MIKVKSGVRLHGITPQIVLAIQVANAIWELNGYGSFFCITSGIEGVHKRQSQHASGNAVDFRTWSDNSGTQMSKVSKDSIVSQLQENLSEEYFVLAEGNHIHLHYKPFLVTYTG